MFLGNFYEDVIFYQDQIKVKSFLYQDHHLIVFYELPSDAAIEGFLFSKMVMEISSKHFLDFLIYISSGSKISAGSPNAMDSSDLVLTRKNTDCFISIVL